jgi:hypothetical protein
MRRVCGALRREALEGDALLPIGQPSQFRDAGPAMRRNPWVARPVLHGHTGRRRRVARGDLGSPAWRRCEAGDAEKGNQAAELVRRVIVDHELKHMVTVGVDDETVDATDNRPL